MRNEIQHPMSEHQKPNDHSCTMISIDACSQESGDQRPDDRHEEAVGQRKLGTASPLYTCEAKNNGENIENPRG